MVRNAHTYIKNQQLKVRALRRYVSPPGNKRLQNRENNNLGSTIFTIRYKTELSLVSSKHSSYLKTFVLLVD